MQITRLIFLFVLLCVGAVLVADAAPAYYNNRADSIRATNTPMYYEESDDEVWEPVKAAEPQEDTLRLFVWALLYSVLLEAVLFILLYTWVSGLEINTFIAGRIVWASFLGTTLTISILWWVLPTLTNSFAAQILVGESGAVLIEALILMVVLKLTLRQALQLTVIANLVSFGSGLLILPGLI